MTSWRAVFVDVDGVVAAQAPGVELGAVDVVLSDVESWSLTVPAGSAAAVELLTSDPLPELECMVLRDGRVVVWGPVVDVDASPDGHVGVSCRGAAEHLARTRIGPAALANEHTDPLFVNNLDDWDALRATLLVYGEDLIFPGFTAVDGLITVVTSGVGIPTPPVNGLKMVRFRGDSTTDGMQIAEDFTVTPTAYRDMEITARAAFYVPVGAPFTPTPINGAIYVSAHDPSGSFPDAYYAPSLISIAEWPDVPVQGTWHDYETTLRLPAGSGTWKIHVAYSPPHMDTFMCLPEVDFDEAIEVTGSTAPQVVATLVTHAQDVAFGHVDRNIATSITSGGPRIDRFYRHAEHEVIAGALRELADQGLLEWRTTYTATARTIVAAETLGAKVHTARVVASGGRVTGATVDGWSDSWSRGSDVVTAQQSGTRAEVAADSGAGLGWEEILAVPDHVPRWRLDEWATAKVAETSTPQVLEVTYEPGSVWATGDALVGDLVDATVDLAGAVRVSGEWRAVRVSLDPESDRASVQLSPVTVTRTEIVPAVDMFADFDWYALYSTEDPDWAIPADGVAVSSWRNAGSVGTAFPAANGTPSQQPVVDADGINGLPSVQGDGTDDVLGSPSTALGGTPWAQLAQPYSIVFLGSVVGTLPKAAYDGEVANASARHFLHRSAGNKWVFTGGATITSAADSDADVHLHVTVVNGASSVHLIDGATAMSGDAGAHQSKGVTLFANNIGTSGNAGEMALWGLIAGDIRTHPRYADLVAMLMRKAAL